MSDLNRKIAAEAERAVVAAPSKIVDGMIGIFIDGAEVRRTGTAASAVELRATEIARIAAAARIALHVGDDELHRRRGGELHCPACPKCGSAVTAVTYCSGNSFTHDIDHRIGGKAIDGEHLLHRCQTCHYPWSETCVPRGVPESAVAPSREVALMSAAPVDRVSADAFRDAVEESIAIALVARSCGVTEKSVRDADPGSSYYLAARAFAEVLRRFGVSGAPQVEHLDHCDLIKYSECSCGAQEEALGGRSQRSCGRGPEVEGSRG